MDTCKEEWEKGVQVQANSDTLPQPSLRIVVQKLKRCCVYPLLEVYLLLHPRGLREWLCQHQGAGGMWVPV